ncbi:MAG: hypothetical protein ACLR0P_05760 [Oscillospiraceae bacterium]
MERVRSEKEGIRKDGSDGQDEKNLWQEAPSDREPSIFSGSLTIVLAVQSPEWSAAQGMADYVFQEKVAGIPELLLGVQGILLGLNFYLPTFWMNTMGSLLQANRPGQPESCYPVLFFCFYLYLQLSGCLHVRSLAHREQTPGPIWVPERGCMMQAIMSMNIKELLRDELGGQVSDLYTQAAALETQEASVGEGLNLEQDRKQYVEGEEGEEVDFAANSEILSAILAMERAMADGASDSEIQQAEQTLGSLEDQVNEQIAQLEIQIRSHRMQSTMHTKWCSRQKIC